jgi:hypothetical protein
MNRWIARLLAIVLAAAAIYLVVANVHAASVALECTLAAAVLAIATLVLLWKRPVGALVLNVVWLIGAFAAAASLSATHRLPNVVAGQQAPPGQAPVQQSAQAPLSAVETSGNAGPSAIVVAEAKRLGASPQALLTRVSDGVRYELYPGVFRGGAATLADGAGNDYDRALLLHDMVVAANAGAVRYAFCTLTPQQADAAIAAAHAAYVSPNVGAVADLAAAKAPNEQLRGNLAKLGAFWRAAVAQERAQNTELAADFQKAGALLTVPSAGDLHPIASDHVWVQLQSQGKWLDLDPSVARAKPGATVCAAAKTSDSLPDAAYDTVTATLHLETRNDAADSDAAVASGAWRTADLADRPLVFAFAESSGLASPAPQPTGMRAYTPLLVAGSQTIAAVPIVVPPPPPGTSVVKAAKKGAVTGGSAAVQAFGSAPPAAPTPAPTPSGPIPVALRLDVAVTAPNVQTATVSLLPFGTLWNIAVNLGTGVAGAGGANAALDPNANDPATLVAAVGMTHRAYYALRRAVFADALAPSPPPVVTAKPGISFLGVAPLAAGPYPFGLVMDRAAEGAVPAGDATAALAWGVASVYGERLAVAATPMMKRRDSLDLLPFDDTIEMFYIARHSNNAPKLVASSADVSALPVSDDAKTRLAAGIANGQRAVAPSAQVGYGGSNDYGWWILGRDGTVGDQMQSGMHQEMGEEGSETEEEVVEEAPQFEKNGFIVRCIAMAMTGLMRLSAAQGGELAGEIAEQVPEMVHAIYESKEQQEMYELAERCAE